MNRSNLILSDTLLNAFDHRDMAVYIKNTKGKYLWANQFFIHRSAGLDSKSDIEFKEDEQFPWHQHAEQLRYNDERLFTEKHPISAYEVITRHNGCKVQTVSKKELLYDPSGQLLGLMGISIALPPATSRLNLTPRETQVATLLCQGLSYKSIALELNLSVRTIETHINVLKTKANTRTLTGLVSLLSTYTTH